MAFRLKTSDYKTLESIAEYRIITTIQIAALLGRNRQSIWRRLRELEKHGLLRVTQREFGRRRGRPEIVLSLSEHGIDVLKEKGVIGADVEYEAVIGDKIHDLCILPNQIISAYITLPSIRSYRCLQMGLFFWHTFCVKNLWIVNPALVVR